MDRPFGGGGNARTEGRGGKRTTDRAERAFHAANGPARKVQHKCQVRREKTSTGRGRRECRSTACDHKEVSEGGT